MITYDKFMEIVPEETKIFVNNILKLLDCYIIEEYDLRCGSDFDEIIVNSTLKKIAIFCYGLSKMDKYSSLIGYYNFNQYNFNFCVKTYDPLTDEEVFNHLSNLFLIYNEESDYYSLLPLDLLANLSKDNLFGQAVEEFRDYLFSYKYNPENFFTAIKKNAKEYKDAYEKKLELEILGNLPISVINYLKIALKIKKELENNLSKSNKDFLTKSNIDYVPLSLLLAVYYYDNNESKNIIRILGKNNIILNKIEDKFKPYALVNYNNLVNNTTPLDIKLLKKEYAKYFTNGVCEDKEQKDITVTDIFTNLLERSITESYIIENLLNNNGNEYEEICNDITNNNSKEDIRERLNSFYQDLSNETREFVEFSSKTLQLIKNKMLENKHNTELLFDINDATILSLYIANCYFDGNINRYFTEYGNITLDKVLKLVNLDISKEEIETITLDKEQMIESYSRFIYKGVNLYSDSKDIDKDKICMNICDVNYAKSSILRRSFNRISTVKIGDNFSNDMNDYFEVKEAIRKINLSEEIFADMQVDTVKFLEDTTRIYQDLVGNENLYKLSLGKKDLHIISLLISALYYNNDLSQFIENHNFFSIDNILDYFDSYEDDYDFEEIFEKPLDIDLFIREFKDLIFNNINIDKKELTINDIICSIFTKELYTSHNINKLFSRFNINYKDRENFDNAYNKYKKDMKYNKIVRESQKLLDFRSVEVIIPSGWYNNKEYMENVVRVHKRIINHLEKSNVIILNEKDIEKISFIVGLIIFDKYPNYVDSFKSFCNKNKLSLSNILEYCNISGLDLTNLEEEIDYNIVWNNYKKYINCDGLERIESILKQGITNKINNSSIIKDIVLHYNGNYDILEEELTTGKEHELSLSERISLLTSESIDKIVTDDINSILSFGNCLSMHSKYIYDELPKLMLSDASNESVDTINKIIDKVYVKEVKKKSWFEKIFSVEDTSENSKLSLNSEAIKELKETINSNISILSKELLVFDKIRKYIEIYQKKNYEYLIIAKDTVDKLEKENSDKTIANDEDYAKILSSNSHLRIMREKVNRFVTSNQFMKQEIFKINQVIVNHFITINALEMARDDLLPLVGAELAINLGRETENNAIELTQNVIGLFQSLLTRNIDTAKENMEKISSLGINNETLNLINRDMVNYISNLELVGIDNNSSNMTKKLVKE